MSEVVNLRLARKRKAREQADADAAVRRAEFGRAKGEKQLTAARRELDERALDAHRIGAKPADAE